MRITLLIFFSFFFLSESYCQLRRDKTEHNSITAYLADTIAKMHILDSCNSGFYFLKFSMDKKGEIKNYTYSESLPTALGAEIHNLLNGLKVKWDKSFVKDASKKGRSIILPLLVNIQRDCLSKLYEKKNTAVEEDLYKPASFGLADMIESMHKTFISSFIFKNGEHLKSIDCIILQPAIIVR